MNEKPIERLKYYNGQRLEADDLKLEQEYHIRVRRWLNKSVFSAGIAEGLEVKSDSGNPQQVIVSPGLALDHEGREIILLEEQPVKVIGSPSKTEGQVDGNYLTIQYREETRAEEPGSCAPHGNGSNKGQSPSGGPSRVRATPILSWSDVFPHDSSGKIVLAQVELSEKCEVRNVYTYPRAYVGPTSLTTVRQYALEGERHIDASNPGRIYFHIRGRQPSAVTLYLRAEPFSTLYYTEMGKHSHGGRLNDGSLSDAIGGTTLTKEQTKHKHGMGKKDANDWHGELTTITEKDELFFDGDNWLPAHYHYLWGWLGVITGSGAHYALSLQRADGQPTNLSSFSGIPVRHLPHRHDITGDTHEEGFEHKHSHTLNLAATILDAGVSDPAYLARGGNPLNPPDAIKNPIKPLTYVDNLQVYIGKVDGPLPEPPKPPAVKDKYTEKILAQLNNAQPTAGWLDPNGNGTLGNGKNTHPLAQSGTGEIRLDLLSNTLSFPEGDYYIQLDVDSGGGRILYNLYVE